MASSRKTSQAGSPAGSPTSTGASRKLGTFTCPSRFLRPMSALHTCVDECSTSQSPFPSDCWPTPTACSYGSGNNGSPGDKREVFASPKKPSLEFAVRAWPTPTVKSNYNRAGGWEKSGDGLATAVTRWPTPCSRDFKGVTSSSRNHPMLPDSVVSWPTPKAQDGNSCGAQPNLTERTKSEGRQLNADWVEQLMGFPSGWTGLPPEVSFSTRSRRHAPSPKARTSTAGRVSKR